MVRRRTDDRAGDFVGTGAKRFGSGDLTLLGASALRSSRFNTDTTLESVSARAASEGALSSRTGTSSTSGKELTDFSKLTAVVDIVHEIDLSTSSILKGVASVASRSETSSRFARGCCSSGQTALGSAFTTVVGIGRNVSTETEENVEIEEVRASGGTLSEKAVTSSSVRVRRGADVSDATTVLGVGEEIDEVARS